MAGGIWPESGNWNPDYGIELGPGAQVTLPAGTVVEWKHVTRDETGSVVWPEGANRYDRITAGVPLVVGKETAWRVEVPGQFIRRLLPTLVGIMKFTAFAFTGSGAMLSEGIHSVAKCLQSDPAGHRHRPIERAPDEDHPYGYGREGYLCHDIRRGYFLVWLWCDRLSRGHLYTPTRGGPQLGGLGADCLRPDRSRDPLDGRVSVRDGARDAKMSVRDFMLKGSDPMGVAVLLEDGAAVLGIFLALGGVHVDLDG